MKTFLAVFFAILAAVFVIWVAGFVIPGLIHQRQVQADDRETAGIIIQTASSYCSPKSDTSLVDSLTEQQEDHIQSLHLDTLEKSGLMAAYSNRLEELGCGFNARHTRQMHLEAQARAAAAKHRAEEREEAAHQDGKVMIYSWPSGGRVSVDGDDICEAPCKVKLEPGSHEVKIIKPGYKDWLKSIDLGPGQEVEVEASLEKAS